VTAFWDHNLPEDLRQLMNQANKHNHVRLTSDAIRSLVLRIVKAEVAEKSVRQAVDAPHSCSLRESRWALLWNGLIVLRGDMLERRPQVRRSSAHYSVEQVNALLRRLAKLFAGCEEHRLECRRKRSQYLKSSFRKPALAHSEPASARSRDEIAFSC